jgi:hypothetical protein
MIKSTTGIRKKLNPTCTIYLFPGREDECCLSLDILWRSPLAQLVDQWLTMREVPGSNPIGDIVFFGGKTFSTVTKAIITKNQ